MNDLKTNGETAEYIASVVANISKIVTEMAGIQLGDRQSTMVESRLKSRMIRLKIASFKDYLDYLKSNKEAEIQALISLMTTHHTFFFREFTHFEFLLNKGLSRMVEKARKRGDKIIRVWSAACSRGQEVYSLAMFLKFHLSHMAPDIRFEIWGTDIDPASVQIAKNAVYKTEELRQSPAMYLEGNWTRGTGQVQNFSKAKDTLVNQCHFTNVNLLNCDSFLENKKFDLIFCRNVFIYFNPEQISQITKTFLKHMDSDGLLFLGVSETLNGLNLDVEAAGPSVYQFKRKVQALPATAAIKPITKPSVPEKIYEVLSVDDSPVIHVLLSKILTGEHGFKITATAKNGREALDILKTKKFDAITLDMHMPELDGLGFLKEYTDRSTPIVIVSSVNRDDTSIAQKALALGASDYVEKPSLENLTQAGNEIRFKIRTLLGLKKTA